MVASKKTWEKDAVVGQDDIEVQKGKKSMPYLRLVQINRHLRDASSFSQSLGIEHRLIGHPSRLGTPRTGHGNSFATVTSSAPLDRCFFLSPELWLLGTAHISQSPAPSKGLDQLSHVSIASCIDHRSRYQ